MKRLSIIAMVFLLCATVLAGCRRPEPGTTGATNNNPSTSTVRPEPTITMPDITPDSSGATNSTGGQRHMDPRS